MAGRNSILRRKYTRNEIVSDLETYLREQELPADTLIASASRLAQRYNVSVATINRALDSLVERKVLYRVQGSGTFTARSGCVARRLKVCVILKDSGQDNSDPYAKVAFGNFNSMMQYQLQAAGHDSEFFYYNLMVNPELLDSLQLFHYDAVISMAGNATPENTGIFRKFNLPVVLIGAGKMIDTDFHQIYYDYVPGFKKLLTHLRDQGHESFLIASLDGSGSYERCEALFAAADQLGIPRDCFVHKTGRNYYMEYWHNLTSAREIGEYFAANRKKFTAVISTSDYVTYGIMSYLREQGLEPGRDYAIGSYDNFEGQGVMVYGTKPVLTSISHPLEKMAREAARLAVSEGLQNSGVTHIIRVPADELTIRSSTKLKHIKTGDRKK